MNRRERFERQFHSGERVEWLRNFGCVVCYHRPSEVVHVKSRGAGGTWRDTVPLCARHHREQHSVGILTFQIRHHVDLASEAAKFASWWDEGAYHLGF